jgi:hypothetical protein
MATPTLPKGIKFDIGADGYVCTFNSTGGFQVVALSGTVVGAGQVIFDGHIWRVSEPMTTGITRPIARQIEDFLAHPGPGHPAPHRS